MINHANKNLPVTCNAHHSLDRSVILFLLNEHQVRRTRPAKEGKTPPYNQTIPRIKRIPIKWGFLFESAFKRVKSSFRV